METKVNLRVNRTIQEMTKSEIEKLKTLEKQFKIKKIVYLL